MRIYPDNLFSAVGFDEIKDIIENYSTTIVAKQSAKNIFPSSDSNEVELMLAKTFETQILLEKINLPELSIIDEIKDNLKEISTAGHTPSAELLNKILNLIKDSSIFFSFFNDVKSTFPALREDLDLVSIPIALFDFLDRILDAEGNIKHDATPELKRLVEQIIAKEKEVRKLLNARFDVAKKNNWAGETEITIRNDRLVMPIIAEHKKKVKGLVYDESASGKYLYIEPIECFEENNRLRELYIQKKREITRILREAGEYLTSSIPDIEGLIEMWEKMDFYSAKAKLNALLEGIKPEFTFSPQINLRGALNPQLILNKPNQELVKNDILINSEHSIILISGPNAGGKSVLLKTAALLQIMFQCGLGITADASSEMFVFKNIFVEISDNQSIENALSTYSAHLTHIKFILENTDKETLVLIDELGSGTDPELATPLSEAILESICETGAIGMVTSHLGSLKKLPESIPNLINASMQYNPIELKPLYKLIIGRPGSSFAFELAQNLNIPKEIIDKAKEKLKGKNNLNYEELTLQLEKQIFELDNVKKKIKSKEAHLNRMIEEYTNLKEKLVSQKSDIIKQAKEKANETLLEADIVLKKVKKASKSSKPQKEKIEDFKNLIENKAKEINKGSHKDISKKEDYPKWEIDKNSKIEVGDYVLVSGTEQRGEVLEITKNKVLVALGSLHSTIELNRVLKLKNTKKSQTKKNKSSSNYSNQILNKGVAFNTTLNVIGDRADIALLKTEKWLDEAYMLGIGVELKILHGKGEGVLKKMIWDFLKNYPKIKSWKYEHADRGGEGATIIEFI